MYLVIIVIVALIVLAGIFTVKNSDYYKQKSDKEAAFFTEMLLSGMLDEDDEDQAFGNLTLYEAILQGIFKTYFVDINKGQCL